MRISRPMTIAAAALVLGAAAAPASAQPRVTIDNDLFGPRGADDAPPDYEYTHGTRVSWTARGRTAGDSRRHVRLEIGQRIYTRRHITDVSHAVGMQPRSKHWDK